jgi:predicted nucleic acid-binding protein
VAWIVLDTDVASLSYKGRLPDSVTSQLVGHTLRVTCDRGRNGPLAEKRHWGTRARTQLVYWLESKVVLPYDANVSYRWGHLIAAGELRGSPRPINDTWIAACCLVAGLPLATLNVKDFTDYVEHEGLTIIAG